MKRMTRKEWKLYFVYGEQLRRVYPSTYTKDYLKEKGIKYAVVDKKGKNLLFLNLNGEIVDKLLCGEGNPCHDTGSSFRHNYYIKHIRGG
jgi:hypothetical protein